MNTKVESTTTGEVQMGKYGLSGNSGLVGNGLHISAPYDSNGMVFVEVNDDEWGVVWERWDKEKAERDGVPIIKCSMCDKPAVSLDHYWPYHTEMNRCENCHGRDEE